jgi:membrane associated rhomboid family serine protease
MVVFFHRDALHLILNMIFLNSVNNYNSNAMKYIYFYYILFCNYILPIIIDSHKIPLGFSGITYGMLVINAFNSFHYNKLLLRNEILMILLYSVVMSQAFPDTTIISHLVGMGFGFLYIQKN